MDANLIEEAITPNTKAVMAIHLAGWPCEMDKIQEICNEHNLFLIEDCAQAHGAKYKGLSVGSFGDVSTWSFCTDKIISTLGEGGMISTNNKKIYEFCKRFINHGSVKKINANLAWGLKYAYGEKGLTKDLYRMKAGVSRVLKIQYLENKIGFFLYVILIIYHFLKGIRRDIIIFFR